MSIKQIVRGWNLPDDVRGLGRLVFLALADHADPQGRCWPAVGRLARKCACSERTVRRHLAEFQRRGLVAIDRRHKDHGGTDTSVYRLFPGPTADGPTTCQGVTGCHPEGVTRCHPRGDKRDRAYIEEPSREPSNNSPQPPEGGVAVLAATASTTTATATAEHAVATAYTEVTGQPWPRKWRRAVRREVAAGSGGLLGQVTAADLRGAMALAEKRERTFGFGWLLRYLEGQAVRQKSRRDAEDRERQKRAAAAADQDRRAAEQTARLVYWATLAPERQQDYLRRAEQSRGPFARYGPPVDSSARSLAWSERARRPRARSQVI